jgi:hypoxanthine phosphoribosyltransferase
VKTLLTTEQLSQGIDRLAEDITRDYRGRPLTVVGVLTGSIVVLSDLIRRLDLPLRLGLVQASSYRGETTSPLPLEINADMLPDVERRHVLLVDDIFDTGKTLLELISQIDDLRPASIRTAVLLEKQDRREVELRPNYVAFQIPDEFVVGYGLDYNDMYRNLPYVAALEPHELKAAPDGEPG